MTKIISVFLAGVLSFFLFAIMNLLIDSEAKAFEPSQGNTVEFAPYKPEDLKPEEVSRIRPKLPEKVEPVDEPQISQKREKQVSEKPLRIASIKPTIKFDAQGDSALGAGALGKNVYAGGGLEKAPTIRVEPQYPMKARYEGIEGSVTLQFDINELGETTNIRVLKSNPKGYFERASKKALKKWRYKKETDEESVVASNQVVTLSFNMQE